ncbi:tubulin-like doman-containing protein [Phormidesmis priestleyi]
MSIILIFAGTTPGAVGMDFRRRSELDRDRCLQPHMNSLLLKRRVTRLQHDVQLLAIDVDATHTYPCHLPMDTTIHRWSPDQFLHCGMPNADLLKSIETGRQSGHPESEHSENVNPHAVRALRSGVHASGGTRPNGYTAIKVNWDAIEERLRRCFQATRLEQSTERGDDPVRVILVASTFGGFASGSLDPIEQLVLEIAESMKIAIAFTCILMIPGGTTISKDSCNGRAVTVAVMKERVAISSQQHVHRQRVAGKARLQAVPSQAVETILISDTNHAKDAQGLKIPSLVSLVSELIVTLVATPIGARLTTQANDFVMRSGETTLTGEPRFASSVGLSTIDLGRDRLSNFGKLTLTMAFLDRFLQPLAVTEVKQEVQTFLVQQRLLAGQGQRDLLDRLLEETVESSSLLNLPRLMGLIEQSIQSLRDTTLLTHAAGHAQLAFQQVLQPCDALKGIFEERRSSIVHGCHSNLEHLLTDLIQDPNKGLASARQVLELLLELLDRIQAEAGEENPQFDDDVNQCQEWLNAFEAQVPHYLQQIEQQRRSLSCLFNRRQIEANIAAELQRWGRAQTDALKRYYSALVRKAAHHASLETLGQFQKLVRLCLTQVQQAERVAADLQTQLGFEQQRLIGYRPEFECPNGLCLHQTESDLRAGYQRILPDEGEACAIGRLINPLLQRPQLLSFLTNSVEFKAQLLMQAQSTLQPKLSGLHVVSELYHRFPQESDLGKVLQQRDRQSFEFIQLKGNCDKDNGVFVVRLLGMDHTHAGALPKLLNQYSNRGQPYEVLDTGDPDKIVFLQYRAVLPYSDWAHYSTAVDDYEQISEVTHFEKFHPVVGSRYLPMPGQTPAIEQAKIAVIYAWMLGRIQLHPGQMGYLLSAAQQAIPLEQSCAVLCSKMGYRCLVDLTSSFNCLYQDCPSKIYDRLNHLRAVRQGTVTPLDPIETEIATHLNEAVDRTLLARLDWWRNNTIALQETV